MGKPTIIMNKGKLLKKNIRNANIDINDILEEARINGFFDLKEIEYAVLETNGHISFLPYAKYKTLTPKDMRIKAKSGGLCANVIIDGNVMHKNLENVGLTEEWLQHNLDVLGYNDLKKIFLCTVDTNKNISVYENNNVKYDDIFE